MYACSIFEHRGHEKKPGMFYRLLFNIEWPYPMPTYIFFFLKMREYEARDSFQL